MPEILRSDSAYLTALALELFANGIFWAHFYDCNIGLWYRHKYREERFLMPVLLIAWIVFALITTHCIISLVQAYAAFVPSRALAYDMVASGQSTSLHYYQQLSRIPRAISSAIYISLSVIADAFLVYRLYTTWGRNKLIIILPTLLCVALLVCGTMIVYYCDSITEPLAISRKWVLAGFCLASVGNIYSTSLLVYRVLYAQECIITIRGPKTRLDQICYTMIRSCLAYCVLVILSLIFVAIQSNLVYIVVATTTPTIGILFCMIVNRTHHDEPYALYLNTSSPKSVTRDSLQVQWTDERKVELPATPTKKDSHDERSRGSYSSGSANYPTLPDLSDLNAFSEV